MSKEEFDIYDDDLDLGSQISDSYLSDAKNSKVDYIGMIEDKEEEDKVKVNDKKEPLSKPVTHAPEETKDIVHSNGDDYKDQVIIRLDGLYWWTNEDEIRQMLSPYGRVTDLRFDEDKKNGKSNGTCFVYMNVENRNQVIHKVKDDLVNMENRNLRAELSSADEIDRLKNYNRGRKERTEALPGKSGRDYSRGEPASVSGGHRGGGKDRDYYADRGPYRESSGRRYYESGGPSRRGRYERDSSRYKNPY